MEYNTKDISAIFNEISDSNMVSANSACVMYSGALPADYWSPSCYWVWIEDRIIGPLCEDKPSWYDECNGC